MLAFRWPSFCTALPKASFSLSHRGMDRAAVLSRQGERRAQNGRRLFFPESLGRSCGALRLKSLIKSSSLLHRRRVPHHGRRLSSRSNRQKKPFRPVTVFGLGAAVDLYRQLGWGMSAEGVSRGCTAVKAFIPAVRYRRQPRSTRGSAKWKEMTIQLIESAAKGSIDHEVDPR